MKKYYALILGLALALFSTTTQAAPTQRPSRVMDVLEYEVGVEISYAAFSQAYGSDENLARQKAQTLVTNLNKRYLHACGIRHRLGNVIVRTSSASDPLKITSNSTGGLSAFRNYWNSHGSEVGTTHDLAVYHVYTAPSGYAYVNSVGSANRYALACGRSNWSWADGTITHEFGHSWNLQHTTNQEDKYESKPRSNGNAGGGSHVFISVMNGNGNHNIGRCATYEAQRAYNARQSKRGYGDVISNPGAIKPFGYEDNFTVSSHAPVTLDVIANDYDCNNDPLNVQLRDTVSHFGAKISLSSGTGPGGRDEIRYIPSASHTGGEDFFHYTVVDTSGKTDWGCVYVNYDVAEVTVDLNKNEYKYDLGTPSSAVFSGYTRISPNTKGDVSWNTKPNAIDRGTASGANDLNRDLIYGPDNTLNHKLRAGKWTVLITFGDANYSHNNMDVYAEGQRKLSGINSTTGNSFFNRSFDVDVTDGTLNLRFDDAGGNDPNWVATRIVLTYKGSASGGGSSQAPYGGSARSITSLIQAEHYDTGGEGKAYHDTSTGNSGGKVRTDNVDIGDSGGRTVIGWTAGGEWLEYTVNASSGTYDIEMWVASPYSGKRIVVKLGGTTLGTLTVPNTGGWHKYGSAPAKIAGVNVSGGNNKILRLEFPDGGLNLDNIKFVAKTAPPPPPSGSDTVDSSKLPTSFVSASSLQVSVPYSTTVNRDVYVELWQGNSWKMGGKADLNSRSGTATINVTGSAPAAGTGYFWKLYMTEDGKNWQHQVSNTYKEVKNVTVTSSANANIGGGNSGGGGSTVLSGLYHLKSAASANHLYGYDKVTATRVAPLQTWPGFDWTLENVSGNVYRLKGKWAGLYLEGSSNGSGNTKTAALNTGSNAQKWTLENISGNTYYLKCNASGNYLHAYTGSWSATVTLPKGTAAGFKWELDKQ